MGQKTALGSLLKAIGNSGQGKVVPGWGAVPVMTVIGLLLLVFLVILLQIYNNHYYSKDSQSIGTVTKLLETFISYILI